jgi:hypothetical protein
LVELTGKIGMNWTCWPRWCGSLIVVCLLSTAIVGFALLYAFHGRKSAPVPEPADSTELVWDIPAVLSPRTHSAGEVRLKDDAQVIGVTAQGRGRAYLLQALVSPEHHVVNDLIGQVPITVTYCNMTDSVRVFTDSRLGQPLDLAVGGWTGHHTGRGLAACMLLRTRENWFRQDDVEPVGDEAVTFPYKQAPFVRTSWKKWRTAHPDTDVYTGDSYFGLPDRHSTSRVTRKAG